MHSDTFRLRGHSTANLPKFRSARKGFNPPFSKGNLYIVKGSVFGSGVLFQVNVDGKVRGAIAEETYLLVELTPGNHTVSVITEDSPILLV